MLGSSTYLFVEYNYVVSDNAVGPRDSTPPWPIDGAKEDESIGDCLKSFSSLEFNIVMSASWRIARNESLRDSLV